MRVLYFHQHFSTPQGAAGMRSYAMARGLIERGHHVVMVCGSYEVGETGLSGSFRGGVRRGFVDGIEVIEFELNYSNRLGFLARTWAFLRFSISSLGVVMTENFDLVFATSTPLTAGIPGVAARWIRRKPFVFEVRDLWPELPKAMGVISNPIVLLGLSALEWIIYRSSQRLVGLSPGIVEGIVRRGVNTDRVRMIPNGCDLDIFTPLVEAWRPNGVSDHDLMAVYTGTHGSANGLDAAIDAAIELEARGRNDIKLVLVGDGKLKPHLEKRARSAGLQNVLFLNLMEKNKLAGLLAGADIGMQILSNVPAFYFGTSPNKFFDYLAAGLPILVNYPGWLSDLLCEHECGLPVVPNDPGAFADALEQAAGGRERLRQMGRRARSMAERGFNRNVLVEEWVGWVLGATK